MEAVKMKVEDLSVPVKDYIKEQCDLVLAGIEPILEDLPDEKKARLMGVISSKFETNYSSPIPPPGMLKGYNEVINSGAERLMQMAEKQLTQRLDNQSKIINARIAEGIRGQFFGLIVVVLGFSLATFLALTGHETLGGIFGTTTIVGLAAVFVAGRRQKNTI